MHPAQDYRGLTQLCQQVRTEFRPLYMSRKRYHVATKDVRRYLNTYVAHPDKANVSGNGVLSVMIKDLAVELLEITPAVQACLKMPNLTFNLVKGGHIKQQREDPERNGMSRFSHKCICNEREAWSDALDKSLTYLRVDLSSIACLVIVIQSAFFDDPEDDGSLSELDAILWTLTIEEGDRPFTINVSKGYDAV